ncbi:hypothetical protein CRE_08927 [Caenorhabditis remanei]|uniref:T20D4.11-like domain-containing protein n=1 Tax=Caenorhabditis remanei TaxID=31234 RepID=E3LIB6_CAERE|nr:hypothetical protein CRE_08927 [Caenorhabditis remanei]
MRMQFGCDRQLNCLERPWSMLYGKTCSQNNEQLCEEAASCLAPYECEQATQYRNTITKFCDFNIDYFPDVRQCLVEFLKDLYLSKSSTEESCLRDFRFLQKNAEEKRAGYDARKTCFYSYVEENCSAFSLEYLCKENYEKLVDVMSSQLNGNDCEGANRKNHQLKALECFAMQEITESRVKELTAFNTFFSSAPVENAFKVCKDTQKCFAENSCVIPSILRYKFDKTCDDLQERI